MILQDALNSISDIYIFKSMILPVAKYRALLSIAIYRLLLYA